MKKINTLIAIFSIVFLTQYLTIREENKTNSHITQVSDYNYQNTNLVKKGLINLKHWLNI